MALMVTDAIEPAVRYSGQGRGTEVNGGDKTTRGEYVVSVQINGCEWFKHGCRFSKNKVCAVRSLCRRR